MRPQTTKNLCIESKSMDVTLQYFVGKVKFNYDPGEGDSIEIPVWQLKMLHEFYLEVQKEMNNKIDYP